VQAAKAADKKAFLRSNGQTDQGGVISGNYSSLVGQNDVTRIFASDRNDVLVGKYILFHKPLSLTYFYFRHERSTWSRSLDAWQQSIQRFITSLAFSTRFVKLRIGSVSAGDQAVMQCRCLLDELDVRQKYVLYLHLVAIDVPQNDATVQDHVIENVVTFLSGNTDRDDCRRIAKPLYGQKLYRGFESPLPIKSLMSEK